MIDNEQILTRDKIETEPNKSLRFLYRTFIGRVILRIMTARCIARFVGAFLDSRASCFMIKGFVRKNHIDTSKFEDRKYHSYNDFFTRKIKNDAVDYDFNPMHFTAPCDSKLSVYEITDESVFLIKDSYYTLPDILDNEELAEKYKGGLCLIFRLGTDDYHRYSYIDNGSTGECVRIKGKLHTVQPIAFEKYNVFKRNTREYITQKTDNYGDVTYVEVGAMLIGRIKNYYEHHYARKGEEKGLFEFGGSTVILLIEKDRVKIDDEILKNTSEGYETKVHLGEKIGVRRNG